MAPPSLPGTGEPANGPAQGTEALLSWKAGLLSSFSPKCQLELAPVLPCLVSPRLPWGQGSTSLLRSVMTASDRASGGTVRALGRLATLFTLQGQALWKLFLEARRARKSNGAGHSQWDPSLDSGHTQREGPWSQSSASWSCLVTPPVSCPILGVSPNLRTSEEKHSPLASQNHTEADPDSSTLPEPLSGYLFSHPQEPRASPLTSLMHRDMLRLMAGAVGAECPSFGTCPGRSS